MRGSEAIKKAIRMPISIKRFIFFIILSLYTSFFFQLLYTYKLIQVAAWLSLAPAFCRGVAISDFDVKTASSGKKRPSRSDKR
jgi:hypothetical protein